MKAKFINSLTVSEPIILTLVVSAGNERQTGEHLMAFIDLVNRNKHHIKHLKIILSFYLQRYYVGPQAASQLSDEWKRKNAYVLEKLDPGITLVLIDWESIVVTAEVQRACEYLTEWYNQNEEFRTIVDLLSTRHAYKADHESAKSYLLEECAFCMIYQGTVCYPSQHLPAPDEYVVKKFNPAFFLCGYFFHVPKVTKHPNYTIQSLSQLMLKLGIKNEVEQAMCFKEVLSAIKRFRDKALQKNEQIR